MEYHIADVVGTGAELDPFRPAGHEQFSGGGYLYLRPRGDRADGKVIVARPDRVDGPGRVYLGNTLDDPSPALVAAIQNRLGVNLDAGDDRLRRILPALLTKHARTDGSRWRPLAPLGDGNFELNLGELVWTQPVIPPQAGAMRVGLVEAVGGRGIGDNFDRANGGLGALWSEIATGGGGASIVSNAVEATGITVLTVQRHEVDLATSNHWVQVNQTYNDITVNGRGGVGARLLSTAYTGYMLSTFPDGGGSEVDSLVNGALTAGTPGSTWTFPNGTYTERIEVNGSTIRYSFDAGATWAETWTDTALTTGFRGGFRTRQPSAGVVRTDNFTGADLYASASRPPIRSGLTPAVHMRARR